MGKITDYNPLGNLILSTQLEVHFHNSIFETRSPKLPHSLKVVMRNPWLVCQPTCLPSTKCVLSVFFESTLLTCGLYEPLASAANLFLQLVVETFNIIYRKDNRKSAVWVFHRHEPSLLNCAYGTNNNPQSLKGGAQKCPCQFRECWRFWPSKWISKSAKNPKLHMFTGFQVSKQNSGTLLFFGVPT